MKKETFKEFGKYLFDIAKILLAIAVITPIAKEEPMSPVMGFLVVALSVAGAYLINKGGKDD